MMFCWLKTQRHKRRKPTWWPSLDRFRPVWKVLFSSVRFVEWLPHSDFWFSFLHNLISSPKKIWFLMNKCFRLFAAPSRFWFCRDGGCFCRSWATWRHFTLSACENMVLTRSWLIQEQLKRSHRAITDNLCLISSIFLDVTLNVSSLYEVTDSLLCRRDARLTSKTRTRPVYWRPIGPVLIKYNSMKVWKYCVWVHEVNGRGDDQMIGRWYISLTNSCQPIRSRRSCGCHGYCCWSMLPGPVAVLLPSAATHRDELLPAVCSSHWGLAVSVLLRRET